MSSLFASARVLAVLLAAARGAAEPAPKEARLSAGTYLSAVAAVEAALAETDPVVVGFGEWHQTRDTLAIPSTLRRFNQEILPAIAPRMSHLIVETWMTSGRCGEVETQVTDELARTLDRPAQTESDIEAALRSAHASGVAPRILTVSCDDYRAMRGDGAAVDYDRTLRLTSRALGNTIAAVVRQRAATRGGSEVALRPFLAVYGGAIHNDVYPMAGLAPYSYAATIALGVLGRYLELDLVVPEYAASSTLLRAQDWWPVYLRARRPGAAVRIRRGPHSFVIVFPEAGGRGSSDGRDAGDADAGD